MGGGGGKTVKIHCFKNTQEGDLGKEKIKVLQKCFFRNVCFMECKDAFTKHLEKKIIIIIKKDEKLQREREREKDHSLSRSSRSNEDSSAFSSQSQMIKSGDSCVQTGVTWKYSTVSSTKS